MTFLLTDIEESTRLWEQHPQAMEVALARHDALAASIIARYGGTLVKHRGEGDSLFAVFARATDAVAAATDLQRALGGEAWPAEIPLRVRIALHTGDAALRVLATSREALKIPGEQRYPVPSLSVPRSQGVERLLQAEAQGDFLCTL